MVSKAQVPVTLRSEGFHIVDFNQTYQHSIPHSFFMCCPIGSDRSILTISMSNDTFEEG